MATSSVSKSAQSTLFNNHYRYRPTTVDQKRVLPRTAKNQPRPATVEDGKLQKLSDEKVAAFINDSQDDKSEIVVEDIEIRNDSQNDNNNNYNNNNNNNNNEIIKKTGKLESSSNDFDLNIHDEERWNTDIEEEEEKSKDFSCEAIYLDNCRKQKTIPVSYFLRHINDPVLVMKHHGLGAPGMRPVSAALMNNSVVTKLDLSDNWLGPEGADHISKMLKENCFITDLNLSENNFSIHGCETLREVLKTNNSITHLTLRGNKFDDTTAPIWAEIISNTIKIENLDLSHNNFGEESGKLLGPAIAENISIKKLNISWNNIRRKGASAMAKGLGANSVIKTLDLSWNGFSQDGCKILLKTLKENETLEELDLTNNRIATEGAVFIAKGLIANQTLRVLKLGLNPMESAGCFSIIKALQKNPNTKIETIDFSEIIVDKYFNDEFKSFQATFPHIQVKTGCDGIKLKPKIKINPVLKLRNFIEKHHIKLIDFFNKFDKDGSMAVSREEFKTGIIELGVRFSEEEIQQLIQELDPDGDGEINYRKCWDVLNDVDETHFKKSSEKYNSESNATDF